MKVKDQKPGGWEARKDPAPPKLRILSWARGQSCLGAPFHRVARTFGSIRISDKAKSNF